MRKRIGMWIGAIAAALIMGSSFGSLSAKADEINLVGLTDDLIRFYISANNELDIIGDSFSVNNTEDIDVLTTGGVTQLLSQFAYVNISTTFANVRSGPSTDYAVVGRLYGGAVATAVDTVGDWTKIVSGNVEGYVLTSFLLFGQEAVDKCTDRNNNYCRVTGTTLNLRAAATTTSSVTLILPAYAELKILEKQTGWYKVRYTNPGGISYTGYVSTDYVTKGYYFAIDKKRVDEISSKALIANAVWPFPSDYNIYSDYGYRLHPIDKVWKLHKGIDIGGTYGAALVSICDGYVSTVGWDASSGNYVVISYSNGLQAKYLHCNQIVVKKGQYVAQGQKVATCGSTGAATGPHLHFTMTLNGNLVDPMDYLANYEWAVKWHCTRN